MIGSAPLFKTACLPCTAVRDFLSRMPVPNAKTFAASATCLAIAPTLSLRPDVSIKDGALIEIFILGFGMFGNLLPIAFNPPPTNDAAACATGAKAAAPNFITLRPALCANSVI